MRNYHGSSFYKIVYTDFEHPQSVHPQKTAWMHAFATFESDAKRLETLAEWVDIRSSVYSNENTM